MSELNNLIRSMRHLEMTPALKKRFNLSLGDYNRDHAVATKAILDAEKAYKKIAGQLKDADPKKKAKLYPQLTAAQRKVDVATLAMTNLEHNYNGIFSQIQSEIGASTVSDLQLQQSKQQHEESMLQKKQQHEESILQKKQQHDESILQKRQEHDDKLDIRRHENNTAAQDVQMKDNVDKRKKRNKRTATRWLTGAGVIAAVGGLTVLDRQLERPHAEAMAEIALEKTEIESDERVLINRSDNIRDVTIAGHDLRFENAELRGKLKCLKSQVQTPRVIRETVHVTAPAAPVAPAPIHIDNHVHFPEFDQLRDKVFTQQQQNNQLQQIKAWNQMPQLQPHHFQMMGHFCQDLVLMHLHTRHFNFGFQHHNQFVRQFSPHMHLRHQWGHRPVSNNVTTIINNNITNNNIINVATGGRNPNPRPPQRPNERPPSEGGGREPNREPGRQPGRQPSDGGGGSGGTLTGNEGGGSGSGGGGGGGGINTDGSRQPNRNPGGINTGDRDTGTGSGGGGGTLTGDRNTDRNPDRTPTDDGGGTMTGRTATPFGVPTMGDIRREQDLRSRAAVRDITNPANSRITHDVVRADRVERVSNHVERNRVTTPTNVTPRNFDQGGARGGSISTPRVDRGAAANPQQGRGVDSGRR